MPLDREAAAPGPGGRKKGGPRDGGRRGRRAERAGTFRGGRMFDQDGDELSDRSKDQRKRPLTGALAGDPWAQALITAA